MSLQAAQWSGWGLALAETARQVRAKTLEVLEAGPESALTWAPRGTRNHIIWHAGHILWVGDVLGLELLGERGLSLAGWPGMFAQDSDPAVSRRDPPGRAEIARLLRAQHDRFLALLPNADAGRYTAVVWEKFRVADLLIHGLHDEGKHTGEMYLLVKMARAGHATDNPS